MLDPYNEYVEKVSLSLIREYLIKKEYEQTLKNFNRETAFLTTTIGFYGSRLALGKDLGLENLMKINKNSEKPFKSMFEVIIKYFLQNRVLMNQKKFQNSSKISSNYEKRQRTRRIQTTKFKKQQVFINSKMKSFKIPSKPEFDQKLNHQHQQTTPLLSLLQMRKLINTPTKEQSLPSNRSYFRLESKESQTLLDPTLLKMKIIQKKVGQREENENSHFHNMTTQKIEKNEKMEMMEENPMKIFLQMINESEKRSEKSKILASHSRTSLDQSQDDPIESDDYNYESSNSSNSTNRIIADQQKSPQKLKPSMSSDISRRGSTSSVLLASKFSEKSSNSNEVKSNLTLGQNLLESKQNLLAQVSLSPEENEIRQQVVSETSLSGFIPVVLQSSSSTSPKKISKSILNSQSQSYLQKSYSSSSSSSVSSTISKPSSTTVTTDQGFKLRDIESLRSNWSSSIGNPQLGKSVVKTTNSGQGSLVSGSGTSNNSKQSFFQLKNTLSEDKRTSRSMIKILDMSTWRELKNIVLGDRGVMQDGWIGQGFIFNYNIPFGLIQKKGGPCGVLAAVQALLLRNLMFGSEYCDSDDIPVKGFNVMTVTPTSTVNNITVKRSLALIGALVEILWRCGSQQQVGEDEGHTNSVKVGLTTGGNCTFGPGSELRIFYDLDELKTFVEVNLHRFDCIGLVYSVVLTRGIQSVQEDMDFANSPLLGQHGYCTQELMNLLTMGHAISNAFDNEYVLGDKILKGISSTVDIGLLSLFEHYNSCSVGSFLKNPKFPLWIICSESHFSLLFSMDMNLVTGEGGGVKGEELRRHIKNFDLYYYDGLARQEKIIKLSISGGGKTTTIGSINQCNNNIIRADSVVSDDDLIPPLEKCIRTKWNGVMVDWNETEPIL